MCVLVEKERENVSHERDRERERETQLEIVSRFYRSLVLNVCVCDIVFPMVSQQSGLSYSVDGFGQLRQCSSLNHSVGLLPCSDKHST